MAAEVSIYACDTAQQAQTAKDILLGQGYTDAGIILMEAANTCIYNAQMFDGGKTDAVYGKIVVIGRK